MRILGGLACCLLVLLDTSQLRACFGHVCVGCLFQLSMAGRRLLMYGAVVVPSVIPLVLLLALGLAHVAVRPFACACTYACLCVLSCLLVEWDVLLSAVLAVPLASGSHRLCRTPHIHTHFLLGSRKKIPSAFQRFSCCSSCSPILNSWFPLFALLGLFALVALLGYSTNNKKKY